MWAKVTSIGLKGMAGYRVNVEVSSYVGNDTFKIVGLPDAAVKESKERIIAALRSLGYTPHGQKITINLSPADQKKMGSMFDLPMAIGVLLSLRELDAVVQLDTAFIGALSERYNLSRGCCRRCSPQRLLACENSIYLSMHSFHPSILLRWISFMWNRCRMSSAILPDNAPRRGVRPNPF